MKIEKITEWLNETFPPRLQEKYDNTGGQVLFRDQEIGGIIFSLDLSAAVIEEAKVKGCNLIINHHPYFFKGMKKFDDRDAHDTLLLDLIDNRISCIALHTNFDKYMNRFLEDKLGLKHERILFQTDIDDNDNRLGFGTLSYLESPKSLLHFLQHVKESLGLSFLVYSGGDEMEVRRVAILNGAGGNSVPDIIKNTEADCILTGDVGHHSARDALDYGVALIDAGHYGTERLMMEYLLDVIEKFLAECDESSLPLFLSETEKSPFRIYLK